EAALDGVPPGLIGYEEHLAGSKGLHMNFVFVAEVPAGAEVTPNDEFGAWRWVDRAELEGLASPLNVRQFGYVALDARWA
ncbi:MAG TPA: NUDIX hydrolase, partial [Kofleriaceae bacterium]|nr:NUDIX hydrolase [Kofleriaceae bacterium]